MESHGCIGWRLTGILEGACGTIESKQLLPLPVESCLVFNPNVTIAKFVLSKVHKGLPICTQGHLVVEERWVATGEIAWLAEDKFFTKEVLGSGEVRM